MVDVQRKYRICTLTKCIFADNRLRDILYMCYCRAVIVQMCLILSVIDCVMTSRLIYTTQPY